MSFTYKTGQAVKTTQNRCLKNKLYLYKLQFHWQTNDEILQHVHIAKSNLE